MSYHLRCMNSHIVRNKKKSRTLKHIKNTAKRLTMSETIAYTSYPYRFPRIKIQCPFLSIGYDVTDNKTNEVRNKQAFFIMNDNFHREDERLKTFEYWPLDWLDRKRLALTGMFYTGEEDKVKCYFCEVEIGRWEREDQPVPEHLRWSPNCPLLRRRTTNNLPINSEELNSVLPPLSYDVCGTHDSGESRSNVYAEYPEYAIEASRERSFTDWPAHMKQTPAQMAEAGFFHSGNGDRVKCFSCGGGLKDWDASDEPWEQHALWLPKCRFLILMKGQNFIDSVMAKKKSMAATSDNDNVKPNCSSVQAQPIVATLHETQTTIPCASLLALKSSDHHGRTCAEEASTSTFTSTSVMSPSTSAAIMYDTIESEKREAPAANTNIPEEKLCKICYTNEYNTAFLPCGHVVACAKCASSVTKCPMCRKHFTDIMRVYFS